MAKPVFLLMGYPASGKSSVAKLKEIHGGREVLNRDKAGGAVADLIVPYKDMLKAGKSILLDNTFPTAESRKMFIDVADLLGHKIHCLWLKTSIEDAQLNACLRMIRKHGKLLTPDEIKQAKDPNTYPPAALFRYRKIFEPPKLTEGFESITEIPFVRKWEPKYKTGAYIFDYDGTLRESKGPKNWPLKPSEVYILPKRKQRIMLLNTNGTRLLGASNQSAVAKDGLPESTVRACFHVANRLLGVDSHGIDYEFCPHKVPPITCWCRKPMPGIGAHFIEKYKLDPAKVTMVGDMTSDKTFATRCGFKYVDAEEFFS